MDDRQPRLLIKNGTLIDGSGSEAASNSVIVVEGNRITHVGPTGAAMHAETANDNVIDAAGKFILPGLIDAHCHISLHQGALPGARYTSSAEFCTLWAAPAIGRVLRAGVTSEHGRFSLCYLDLHAALKAHGVLPRAARSAGRRQASLGRHAGAGRFLAQLKKAAHGRAVDDPAIHRSDIFGR